MFQPNYLQELIAVGEADAEASFDELVELLEMEPAELHAPS